MKTIAQQLNIKTFPFEIKNDRGNKIYYETSSGYWEKHERDKHGNMTRFENSNGYWVKREYDDPGNELYYENSDGYWEKHEYDEKGIKIYRETGVHGVLLDKRPNKEVLDALALLEKAGMIVDGKIIKI
jgi:hypothetical protein